MAQVKTLPAKYYTDPDYFRAEVAEFFHKDWVCVGHASQLRNPNDFFVREIGTESIILTRGADRKIRALYNVCRHRGTRMCEEHEGTFKKASIQCPYHAWTYGLDGALLGAPHMNEVKGFKLEDYPLHTAACDVWHGFIFVNLSERPRPLQEQMGNLTELFAPWHMDELAVGKREVYHITANWKLIIQNYSECLHCPMIHPALARVSHYMSGDNEPPNARYLGGRMTLNDGVHTMSFDGKQTRAPLAHLSEELRRHVYYYALLPNLLLSPHPDFVMTHTLWPREAGLTDIICEFWFHPDEMKKPGFRTDDAVAFWDVTNKQDWHVSELSQKGISSKAYEPGPYSNRETLLHGLDRIVLDRMQ